MGRRLPKRECSKCRRVISIMSWVTQTQLREHKCVPLPPPAFEIGGVEGANAAVVELAKAHGVGL